MPKHTDGELMVLAKEILENRRTKGFDKKNPMDALILHGEKKEG